MMMKSVFWWRKPEYPEETTDLRQVTALWAFVVPWYLRGLGVTFGYTGQGDFNTGPSTGTVANLLLRLTAIFEQGWLWH